MDLQTLLLEKQMYEEQLDLLEEQRHSTAFSILDRDEQILLNRQSVVMHGLVEIFDERIALFKHKNRS